MISMKCIAMTRSGSQCRNSAKDGLAYCGIHSNTPVDIAPFAESLPDNLVDDFVDSLGWKRLLSNRADISYLEARKAELLRQAGGGRNFFTELLNQWQLVEQCEKAGDTPGREAALREVGDLIRRGKRSEKWKADYLEIIERTRRLRADEINAEMKIGMLIPLAQVMMEMKQYVAIVLAAARRATDPETYARLAGELEAIQRNPPVLAEITGRVTIDL